jgi:hypothetical protein
LSIVRTALLGLILAAVPGKPETISEPTNQPVASLGTLRQTGNLTAQRRHVWNLIAELTAANNHEPQFESWHGEGDLFSAYPSSRRGIRGFSREGISDPQTPDVPVLSYTLYNDVAYNHIVRFRLNQANALDNLRKTGVPDKVIVGDSDVPSFPSASIVLKTAWWPVAHDQITALPVWDPNSNPPDAHGNPYSTWQRVVAVVPDDISQSGGTTSIEFAGDSFPEAHRVSLSSFQHFEVDAESARAMMMDPETRKATLIALGRPLMAGDHLILVAANLAARELPDWIWATFWWHDQPQLGPFAKDRPPKLSEPWANYLMQTAFDETIPAAADGGPHVAFNPWLEGRFPDGGHGSGRVSNCMACHRRASYPAVSFLPITRGGPDIRHDVAFAPKRLRTNFLWSLAMHAKTGGK